MSIVVLTRFLDCTTSAFSEQYYEIINIGLRIIEGVEFAIMASSSVGSGIAPSV